MSVGDAVGSSEASRAHGGGRGKRARGSRKGWGGNEGERKKWGASDCGKGGS